MTILSILSILFGSNWSTTCVMTQADGLQGYTIDQVSFEQNTSDAKKIEVVFKRTWFKDEKCTNESSSSLQNASLTIGSRLNPNTFEADWNINGKTELGAIAIENDGKSLRMATSSFGNSRNTMLSLFSYFAK